jgi:hypothetical protein
LKHWGLVPTTVNPTGFGGELCPRCHHPQNPLPKPFYKHQEWCDFWVFVDQVAPARGLQNLRGAAAIRRIHPRELDFTQFVEEKLLPTLDELQIEYVLYCLHGIWGKMYQVFIPLKISVAIEVYALLVLKDKQWTEYQDLETFLYKWITCDDPSDESPTGATDSTLPQ